MECPRDVYLSFPHSTVNYKVSLDDLDLALLPIDRLMDKCSLLSSRQRKGQSEGQSDGQSERQLDVQLDRTSDCDVVEFEMIAEILEQDCANAKNAAKEEWLTRFCHICNVAVPKKYTKEHNRSKLHVTLLQLANEAVGRLNKHIQQQLSEDEETCYCAPCNQVVDSVNIHEKEMKHILKQKREDLLVKLLDIYTEDRGTFNDRNEQITTNVESQIPSNNNVATSSDSLKMPTDKNESVSMKNCIERTKSEAKVSRNVSSEHHNIAKETSEKIQKTNTTEETLEKMQKTNTAEETLEKMQKTNTAKNTFEKIQKTKPAEETLETIQKTNTAEETLGKIQKTNTAEKTLDKIQKRNTDKKNNSATSNDIVKAKLEKRETSPQTSYNQLPRDSNLILQEKPTHQQIVINKVEHASKDTDFFCNTCAVKVPNKTSKYVIEHNNWAAYRANLKENRKSKDVHNESNVGTPKDKALADTSLVSHNPIQEWKAGSSTLPHFTKAFKDAQTTDFYYCNICAVEVPNDIGNITQHDSGIDHKTKIEELRNAMKGIVKEPSESKSKVDYQEGSSVVSQKLTQAAKSEVNHASKDTDYFCNTCAVRVPNKTSNITEHNNGAAHRANIEENRKIKDSQNESNVDTTKDKAPGDTSLIPHNPIQEWKAGSSTLPHFTKAFKEAQRAEFYFCIICAVKVPNHIENITEHDMGIAHRKKIEELRNAKGIFKEPSENKTLRHQEASSVVSHKLTQAAKGDDSDSTDHSGYYFCNICAVKVPNHIENITEHDMGIAHRKKIEELRNANGIFKEPSENKTLRHQEASSVVSHKLTQAAKGDDSDSTDHSGYYLCNICAVKVPNHIENITEHDMGIAHRKKIEELRNANGIFKEPSENKTLRHQEASIVVSHKLTQAAKGDDSDSTDHSGYYFCNICAVKINNNTNDITGHNNGALHKRKFKELQNSTKNTVSSIDDVLRNVNETDYVKKDLARVNCYCTVCEVDAGGYFEQHLISKRHRQLIAQSENNLTEEIVGYNHCETCNVEMKNCHKTVEAHYTGTSHKRNFQTYLAKNKIKEVGQNQIRCIVCKNVMHIGFVWCHIRNIQHVENLKKYNEAPQAPPTTNPDFCYICKVKVDRNNMKLHVNGQKHKLNLEETKV